MSVDVSSLDQSSSSPLPDPIPKYGPLDDCKPSDSHVSIDTEVDPSSMSMRTFVQFDSPPQSDDEGSMDDDGRSVSPLSVNTPPSTGTRWIRFFPELSSHFSLSSPPIKNSKQFTPFPTLGGEENGFESRRRHSSGPVELKPASSSSFEGIDDASSCYSRRTSLTSAGSEYIGESQFRRWTARYKSPDSFSIISPAAAGVFDDIASARQSCSPLSSKYSISSEKRNKPLPEAPPTQLVAPLSVRRNHSPSSTTTDGSLSASSNRSQRVGSPDPTLGCQALSQVNEELDNTLAGFAIYDWPPSKAMEILNGPLQISRGNMDMTATRPAPQPPVPKQQRNSKSVARVLSRQRVNKTVTFEEEKPQRHEKQEKQPKKAAKHKSPFSFSVPGFGRKAGHPRLHIRSLSSSSVKAETQTNGLGGFEKLNEAGSRYNVVVPSNSNKESSPRPLSISSERELRQRLPRLQTKKMQTVSPPSSSNERVVVGDKNPISSPVKSRLDAFKGKIFESGKRQTNTFVLPCQIGSLQVPEVIFYELEARPPLQPIRMGKFPADAPDGMILSILSHSNSLDDLFNFAVINKAFYRVFKKNELQLIKNTLYDMSPPAWELRQMSPPWDAEWQILLDPDAQVPEYTPALYLRRYAQDIFILAQLKSLILTRCSTFLRHDTIRGLGGLDSTRAAEVDEAFWRIWTFCRIFGCGKSREDNLEGQIDWLNGGVMAMCRQSPQATAVAAPFSINNVLFEPPDGFGRGNAGGLSQSQLYDMTEIWTCLNVLLQPIHGKCAEAREVGIFDGFKVAEGDTSKEEPILGVYFSFYVLYRKLMIAEEWTAYVLSLGLSAVLCLSSICPSDTSASTFRRARSIGLTKWEPCESGCSRSLFLKDAVAKVYKLREEEASSPESNRLSNSSMQMSDRSFSQANGPRPTNAPNADQDHRQRQAAFAAELRATQKTYINSSFENERPLSNYTFIMNHLEGRPGTHSPSSSMPPVPAIPAAPVPAVPARSRQPQNDATKQVLRERAVAAVPAPSEPPRNITQTQTFPEIAVPAVPAPPIPPRNIARMNSDRTNTHPSPPQPTPPTQLPQLYQPVPHVSPQPVRPSPKPQVLDPVDRAIRMMVRELGFNEGDAKWALKITDTGEGIDVDSAVSLLFRERISAGRNNRSHPASLLDSVRNSRESKNSGWRWN